MTSRGWSLLFALVTAATRHLDHSHSCNRASWPQSQLQPGILTTVTVATGHLDHSHSCNRASWPQSQLQPGILTTVTAATRHLDPVY